jgi:anti-sigma factor RsiW
MRYIWGGCELRQSAYLAAADRLGAGERIALEAHASTCADCADALRNGRPLDGALRVAFAPLRERRTIIAPGRVRMAVGPRTVTPSPWLRMPRLFGRLTEVTMMVAVTLFAVGSSLDWTTRQSAPVRETPSVIEEYFRAQTSHADNAYVRWLRLVSVNDSATVPSDTPVEIQREVRASPR